LFSNAFTVCDGNTVKQVCLNFSDFSHM